MRVFITVKFCVVTGTLMVFSICRPKESIVVIVATSTSTIPLLVVRSALVCLTSAASAAAAAVSAVSLIAASASSATSLLLRPLAPSVHHVLCLRDGLSEDPSLARAGPVGQRFVLRDHAGVGDLVRHVAVHVRDVALFWPGALPTVVVDIVATGEAVEEVQVSL